MEKFSENFKGGKPVKECPLCGESEDNQIHSFVCPKMKENIEVEGKLEDIFSPVIGKEIAKPLENIVTFRVHGIINCVSKGGPHCTSMVRLR